MATVSASKRDLGLTSATYISTSDVTIGGNLTVDGTTVTLNTATLQVEDKNIELNKGGNASSSDGAGISILRGTSSSATLNWDNTNARHVFSNDIKVVGGGFTTDANYLQVNTPSGYIQMGAMNTSHAHIYTDRASFYTNKPILILGNTVLTTASTQSKYLRSDEADSFSGILTGTSSGENLKIGGIRGTAKGSQTGEYIHLYERVHIGGPSGWGASTHGAPGQGLSTWGSANFGMNASGVLQLNSTTFLTKDRLLQNVTNTNWDKAYGWGDHASAGYKTTDNDTIFNGGDIANPVVVANRSADSILHFSQSGNWTGAVKITLPGTHSSNWSMLVLRITVYEYTSEAHTTYTVSGHDWTSGWYNKAIKKWGNSSKNIDFAYSTGSNTDCLIVGEVGSAWSYGHVTVDVVAHPSFYSSSMNLDSGWKIEKVTNLDGITRYNCVNEQVHDSGDFSTADVAKGVTAHGYGNHASAGYATGTIPTDFYSVAAANDQFFSALRMNADRNIVAGTDLDKDLEAGGTFSSYGAANTSWNAPGSYGGVVSTAFTSGINGQHFYDIRHNTSDYSDFWFRSKNNLGFSPWSKVWTNLNDGKGSGLDADKLDGLDLHTGRNNEANKVVRTDVNGYIQAGWINTTSGDNGTNSIGRIYASGDGYIRYYTPANFISLLGLVTTTGYNKSNWDTAYGWGNHASAGYLTSLPSHNHTGVHPYIDPVAQNAPDFDTLMPSANHTTYKEVHAINNGKNIPTGAYTYGVVKSQYMGSMKYQQYIPHTASRGTGNEDAVYFRSNWGSNSWYGWKYFIDSGNIGTQSVAFATNSGQVDGIDGASLLRSDAADTFTGTLTMGTQFALVANNYGRGMFGIYSSTRYQHVWSMGTSYKLTDDGTGAGNLYGIAYTHTNKGGESKAGLSHQALFMHNGVTHSAIGTGMWTKGLITTTSYGTSANWKAAYDWGDHAAAGYLTALPAHNHDSSYLGKTSKAADSELLDGLNSTKYLRDNGWNNSPGQDADTQPDMSVDFSYANNAPASGPLVRLGASNYSLQLSSTYNNDAGGLYYRSYNNDSAKRWNPWRTIFHSGVFTNNSGNWNTAYGWGDHSKAGYGSKSLSENKTYTSGGNAVGSYLGGHYSGGGTEKPNSATFGSGKLKIAMLSSGNLGFGGSWNDVLWISAYNGGDVKGSHALVFDKYSTNVYVSDQSYDSASWGTGYQLWHTGHFQQSSINNWNTAYGWGNHASAGYKTTDNNTQLSDADIAKLGYIKTDTNTTYNFYGNSFTSRNSSNAIAINSATSNMTGYTNGSSEAGYADGGLFVAAYSSSWVSQIFSNFRTGEISVRGKNNGTWQGWRFVHDSGHFSVADVEKGVTAHGWGNHASAGYKTTDNNTQLTTAQIAAMGYIKTYTDTNTQLSDADITKLGYIKTYTDTNTQLTTAQVRGKISASGNSQYNASTGVITSTNTNTQLSDGDIGKMGYTKVTQANVNSSTVDKANGLSEVGYGVDEGTFYQTSGSFAGYSGWANYWIGNHGNGQTYYNTVDIRPFWGVPRYSRQEGTEGVIKGPFNYWTEENFTPSSYSVKSSNENVSGSKSFSSSYNEFGNGYASVSNNGNWHGRVNIAGTNHARLDVVCNSDNIVTTMYSHSGHNAGKIGLMTNHNLEFLVNGGVVGQFDTKGAFAAAGDVTPYYKFSDRRLKTKVQPLKNNLERVLALHPVSYQWKEGDRKGNTEIGLIAQEVEEIVPEVVRDRGRLEGESTKEYKSVDYENLVSLLIGAVKEQQEQINELKSKMCKCHGK